MRPASMMALASPEGRSLFSRVRMSSDACTVPSFSDPATLPVLLYPAGVHLATGQVVECAIIRGLVWPPEDRLARVGQAGRLCQPSSQP